MTDDTHNLTVDLMIARLPPAPLLTPLDISSAIGFKTTAPVIRKIQSGEIPALNYGTPERACYFVSREAAVDHIKRRASGSGSL